jgi:hypothetical protein
VLPLGPGANNGNIGCQAILPLVLGESDLHIFHVYIDVFGDDGDQLILQRLQQLGRHVHSVLNQHQLQAILGNLTAGWFLSTEQTTEPVHRQLLREVNLHRCADLYLMGGASAG